MTTSNVATELRRLVQQVQDERADHVKAIEAIDQTFQELGLAHAKPTVKARRGRPVGSKNAEISNKRTDKRTRETFAGTADEFVLAFVEADPGCTTAQINEHWIMEGRNGKADQTLSKLAKSGLIVRNNIKGKRGSTYTVK